MRVQRYALFPTPANLEGNFSPITTFLLSIPIRSLLQEGGPRADTQKQGPGPQDKNQDFLQRLSRRHPEALPSALKRKIGSSNISSDAWSWVSVKAHKKNTPTTLPLHFPDEPKDRATTPKRLSVSTQKSIPPFFSPPSNAPLSLIIIHIFNINITIYYIYNKKRREKAYLPLFFR